MARTRVEQLLDEVAQLTPEEQQAFAQALPRVLQPRRSDSNHRGLTTEAVERAITAREHIRTRLLAEGRPVGSLRDDLEAVRDARLADPDRADRWGPAAP